MSYLAASRGPRRSWISVLGILCIALVLLTGMVQVTHSHPNGHIDPECSLCMTAHHVVQIVVAITLVFSWEPLARQVAESFTPLPRQRFVLKLANRPPPVPAVFA